MQRGLIALIGALLLGLAGSPCSADPLLSVVFTANSYGYFKPCPT